MALRTTIADDHHSAEVLCRIEDKLPMLARLCGLGAAVSDIDISRPGLDEIYRHFSPEAPEDQ